MCMCMCLCVCVCVCVWEGVPWPGDIIIIACMQATAYVYSRSERVSACAAYYDGIATHANCQKPCMSQASII